jgi:hypothetical protein
MALSTSALRTLASAQACAAGFEGGPLQLARETLGQVGEDDQGGRTRKRDGAKQGMHQEDKYQVEGHPWQIEDGNRPLTGKKGAHGIDVAQRLQRLGARRSAQWRTDSGGMHQRRQLLIEAAAEPQQDLAAKHVQNALEQVKRDGEDRQGDQGCHAVAGQNPIVDLQHVE